MSKESFKRLTPINSCRVVEVMEVKSLVGSGTDSDPMIEITEYYSLDGELLARYNPFVDELERGEWL